METLNANTMSVRYFCMSDGCKSHREDVPLTIVINHRAPKRPTCPYCRELMTDYTVIMEK